MRTLDGHAEQYLKIFTLLQTEKINEIMQEHVKAPEKRLAQRTLASEVVTLVHRADVTNKCILQTAALYPAPVSSNDAGTKRQHLKSDMILQVFRGDDNMLKRLPISAIANLPLSCLLRSTGLTKSNSNPFGHIVAKVF